MKKGKNQKGFSLVELLVVVIIVGIIAAIAIPSLLSSRRAANEASAISNLRTIHSANAAYAAIKVSSGYFAPDFATLSGAPQLLDSSWTGTPTKNSFVYKYTVDNSASPTKYCVQAVSGDISAKDFGIVSDGVVYTADHGKISCAAGLLTGDASLKIQGS